MTSLLIDYSETSIPDQNGNSVIISTYTLPANTLDSNGDRLVINYVKTGGSPIDFTFGDNFITSIVVSNGQFIDNLQVTVIRTSATSLLVVSTSNNNQGLSFVATSSSTDVDFTIDQTIAIQAIFATTLILTTIDLVKIDESTTVITS